MVAYLTRFIKHNTSLLHVNLDNTWLTEKMLWELCTCLRRAPSLISLHVSGNPGLNDEFKKQVARRIKCRPARAERKVTLDLGTEDEFTGIEVGQAKDSIIRESMAVRKNNKLPVLDGKMTEQAI